MKDVYAGFGKIDITPEPGSFGSLRLSPAKRSRGVHDPIFATAMSLREGENHFIIVSLDVGMLEEKSAYGLRTMIAENERVSIDNVLAACSHTHQGPETLGEEPEIDITTVLSGITEKAAQAARKAVSAEQSARLGWGNCFVPEAAKNRFYSRIGKPGGPADPRLDFLRVENSHGNILGVLWHFTAHPTTCMRADFLSSADYPGIVNREVEKRFGGTALFLNGACGNINPVLGKRTFEACGKTGNSIASELCNSMNSITYIKPNLASASCRITIPWTEKAPDTSSLPAVSEIRNYFQGITEQPPAPSDYWNVWDEYQHLRTAWWRWRLKEMLKNKGEEEIPLQLLAIGDRYLGTVPGELFVELQLELAHRFPGERPLIIGYSGGSAGYIPDEKSYEYTTYETSPTLMHRAGKSAGTKIVSALESLIITIKNRRVEEQ